MTNLHESFSKLKSDYTKVFHLIDEYLEDEAEAPVLTTIPAAKCISRLSHGSNCVNIEQKMLGLKLLFSIMAK